MGSNRPENETRSDADGASAPTRRKLGLERFVEASAPSVSRGGDHGGLAVEIGAHPRRRRPSPPTASRPRGRRGREGKTPDGHNSGIAGRPVTGAGPAQRAPVELSLAGFGAQSRQIVPPNGRTHPVRRSSKHRAPGARRPESAMRPSVSPIGARGAELEAHRPRCRAHGRGPRLKTKSCPSRAGMRVGPISNRRDTRDEHGGPSPRPARGGPRLRRDAAPPKGASPGRAAGPRRRAE